MVLFLNDNSRRRGFALSVGRKPLPDFRREGLQGMGNDLTAIIYDERISHAVKQRILSQQGMEPEQISSDQVTRSLHHSS